MAAKCLSFLFLLLLLFFFFAQIPASSSQSNNQSSSSSSNPNPVPSYAAFTFDATLFPTESDYDYIVVGGGTSGCPLAATLSLSHRVLLLERGGPTSDFPSLGNQEGFLQTLTLTSNDSPTQPFVSDAGIPNTRRRVLGGSSAMNAGFYSRAHPDFFKDPLVRWDAAQVDQAYEWVERAVAFEPQVRRWQSAIRDGLVEAGVTPYNGFTVFHVEGTKVGATTFDGSGRRHSAADLLDLGNKDNLSVATRASVERILLNSNANSNPSHSGIGFLDIL